MLQRRAGKKECFSVLGVIPGDAKDDEIERVCFSGIERVQKIFCSRKLRNTSVVRRKGELAGGIIEGVDPELRHQTPDYHDPPKPGQPKNQLLSVRSHDFNTVFVWIVGEKTVQAIN